MAELIADLINWTDRKAMKVIKGRCLDYFKKMLDEYEHLIPAQTRPEQPDDAPEPKPSCATCRFNGGDYTLPDANPDPTNPTIKCIRRAPVATGGMMSPASTIWPALRPSDWCGEFEKRTVK